MLMKRIFGVFVALVATTSMAMADGGRTRPMIEIGGGTETAGDGMNILIRVGAGIVREGEPIDANDLLGPEQFIIARVRGDFSISPDGNAQGFDKLPYMNIEFTPIANRLSISNENGNSVTGELALLPIGFDRDIRANRNLAVRVSIVKAEFGTVRVQNEKIALFAKVAAELLGYKMIAMADGMGTFNGFRLFGVTAEGGVAINFTENFMVRISAGVSADFSMGGHDGFAIQSDHGAFIRVTADITKWLQIFIQGSVTGRWDSQSGYQGVPQFMAGVIVIF